MVFAKVRHESVTYAVTSKALGAFIDGQAEGSVFACVCTGRRVDGWVGEICVWGGGEREESVK